MKRAQRSGLRVWFALVKPGDWLTLGLGAVLVAALFAALWHGGSASRAIVRAGGKIYAELSLTQNQSISVPGPLGVTRIVVRDGQVRVAADPGPRQYCVRQGWLKAAGEIAICLPNQVSVELAGAKKLYDSLNY